MNKKAVLESPIYPIICRIYNLIGLKVIESCGGRCRLAHDSLFRRSRIVVKGNGSLVKIGNKCRFRKVTIVIDGKNSTVEILDSVKVYERCNISIVGDNCRCVIGNKTTIGSANLSLEESRTNITIGENCMISRGVRINTSDKHSIIDMETGERINHPLSIAVGNHVWVGHGVSLGKGCSVADDSVVGEHALVTKKFTQPNVCLVGIPAKIVKENINWTREKL